MTETLRTSPCNLCPRMCGARRDEGQRGVCGAGAEIAVARAALHFWEEPPLSGERGSGAVFFAHCPLRCVYCQNADLAAGRAGRAIGEGRLSGICLELQGQGALNVNFVTPTHYTPHIMRAVAAARESGLRIPVVWNTSGYERAEVVHALAGTVDVWLADFKYADADVAQRYSHAPDYPEVALSAIEAMLEVCGTPAFEKAPAVSEDIEAPQPQAGPEPPAYDEVDGQPRMTRGVIVRHLLLPGQLEQSKRALALLHAHFGDDVLYSIMNQYTPVMPPAALKRFPELAARVPDEEYERLLDFADDLGLTDYFWQTGPAAEESFIPAWDNTGV